VGLSKGLSRVFANCCPYPYTSLGTIFKRGSSVQIGLPLVSLRSISARLSFDHIHIAGFQVTSHFKNRNNTNLFANEYMKDHISYISCITAMINHKFTTNLFIRYTTLYERGPVLPGLYNAIHRINMAIQRTSVNKTNHAIHCIVIHQADSVTCIQQLLAPDVLKRFSLTG